MKPLSETDFKYIYSKVPRLTVEVLIINSEKQILLSQRAIEPYKGMWHTPGGTVHLHEKLETAVRRVAKNEIGVDVRVIGMVGVLEIDNQSDQAHHVGNSVSLVYRCEIIGGEPFAGMDTAEVKFFEVIPEHTIPEQKFFYDKLLSQALA